MVHSKWQTIDYSRNRNPSLLQCFSTAQTLKKRSYITIQLYMNEGFEGGNTTFLSNKKSNQNSFWGLVLAAFLTLSWLSGASCSLTVPSVAMVCLRLSVVNILTWSIVLSFISKPVHLTTKTQSGHCIYLFLEKKWLAFPQQ